ncbi:alkaline phosphatase D family protein [Telluribacter sp.]|jgi:alkaline phosphatase D|uniref:alkaline phosphatase D family protein n=1 Tax=Telluribacter sp. TaxID=1978767 RepID=UPI002E14AF5E|nr:alkaline phosphatase D family protein [Telluribacter sp.]
MTHLYPSPKYFFTVLAAGLLSVSFAFAQLQSGPMVGYSDMLEVMLWAQTDRPAQVKIMYWEAGNPAQKKSTDKVLTQKQSAYVARLFADQVRPGQKYEYEVYIDNKKVFIKYPLRFQTQTLWQWRTDPPPFRFAIGSCNYINEEGYDRPSRAYGDGYEIFQSIADKKPDFMLWGGDNTYLREADWNTRSGMLHRYTHTRSLPRLQSLLGSTHHYAIWDDHDYGTDDSDRSFWMKNTAAEVFRLFWGNPGYVFEGATTGTFFWSDAQFFILDNRWFKAPNKLADPLRDYFGDAQIRWLLDALTSSKAPFKFIVTGGQIINPARVLENYANYSTERDRLLAAITEARIPGVLFLTGDRHHTSVHRLDRPGTYPLYDFTISPLTSGTTKPFPDELTLPTLDSGTLVTERNFATFDVSGPQNDRALKVTVYDVKGKELWTRQLRANDLK